MSSDKTNAAAAAAISNGGSPASVAKPAAKPVEGEVEIEVTDGAERRRYRVAELGPKVFQLLDTSKVDPDGRWALVDTYLARRTANAVMREREELHQARGGK